MIPGAHGGVVAFAQVIEDFRVHSGVSPCADGLDGGVSAAQDGDDVAGPVLDDVLGALLDARQP